MPERIANMTLKESNINLEQAKKLIFSIEKNFVEGEFPRLHAYQARIAISELQNALRLCKNPDNISEQQ